MKNRLVCNPGVGASSVFPEKWFKDQCPLELNIVEFRVFKSNVNVVTNFPMVFIPGRYHTSLGPNKNVSVVDADSHGQRIMLTHPMDNVVGVGINSSGGSLSEDDFHKCYVSTYLEVAGLL